MYYSDFLTSPPALSQGEGGGSESILLLRYYEV